MPSVVSADPFSMVPTRKIKVVLRLIISSGWNFMKNLSKGLSLLNGLKLSASISNEVFKILYHYIAKGDIYFTEDMERYMKSCLTLSEVHCSPGYYDERFLSTVKAHNIKELTLEDLDKAGGLVGLERFEGNVLIDIEPLLEMILNNTTRENLTALKIDGENVLLARDWVSESLRLFYSVQRLELWKTPIRPLDFLRLCEVTHNLTYLDLSYCIPVIDDLTRINRLRNLVKLVLRGVRFSSSMSVMDLFECDKLEFLDISHDNQPNPPTQNLKFYGDCNRNLPNLKTLECCYDNIPHDVLTRTVKTHHNLESINLIGSTLEHIPQIVIPGRALKLYTLENMRQCLDSLKHTIETQIHPSIKLGRILLKIENFVNNQTAVEIKECFGLVMTYIEKYQRLQLERPGKYKCYYELFEGMLFIRQMLRGPFENLLTLADHRRVAVFCWRILENVTFDTERTFSADVIEHGYRIMANIAIQRSFPEGIVLCCELAASQFINCSHDHNVNSQIHSACFQYLEQSFGKIPIEKRRQAARGNTILSAIWHALGCTEPFNIELALRMALFTPRLLALATEYANQPEHSNLHEKCMERLLWRILIDDPCNQFEMWEIIERFIQFVDKKGMSPLYTDQFDQICEHLRKGEPRVKTTVVRILLKVVGYSKMREQKRPFRKFRVRRENINEILRIVENQIEECKSNYGVFKIIQQHSTVQEVTECANHFLDDYEVRRIAEFFDLFQMFDYPPSS